MEFWIRQSDHEEWRSISPQGAILPVSTYAILTRSPQPHFTISVDVYRCAPNSEDKGLQQQRFTRTDEEGIGEILPLTPLEPGQWEFHCRDGDLIAELFGENRSDVLSFEILSAEALQRARAGYPSVTPPSPSAETRGPSQLRPRIEAQVHPEPVSEWAPSEPHSPQPPPLQESSPTSLSFQDETEVAAEAPVNTPTPELPSPPSDKTFSLMHSRLQGSPGEVLVLTGRIGCSGDLEARVYNRKQLVFENQRTIRLPNDVRSAVFSIQVPLPSSPWSGTLIGTLTLRGSTDDSHSSLTFTVSCLEQKNGSGAAAPLRSPLLSKAPQEIPLNQYLDSLAPEPTSPQELQSVTPPEPLSPPHSRVPQTWSSGPDPGEEQTLFTARTLRKMMRICHEDGDRSQPSEPQDSSLLSPQALEQSPANFSDTDGESTTDLNSHQTGDGSREDNHSIQPEPESATVDLQELNPQARSPKEQNGTEFEPNPDLDPPLIRSGVSEPDPDPLASSTVAMAVVPLPEPTRSHPASQPLPMPEIWVQEPLRAGETVDVVLQLHSLDDEAPLWIKLWVKQDRTRSILDGPRWLLDFTRTDQGHLQAITRMTIPQGAGEIVFEAWAVTPDLSHQGERTLLRRSIE